LKRIMILAGGGGHTGYARILAEQLRGKAELHFMVPEDDRLSYNLLEPFGEVATLIKPRHPTTPTWRYALRFPKAFHQSLRQIKGENNFVVSTGSNFCIAPAVIAWLKGVPVINIESADRMTRSSQTSRILQPISTVTALHWEEQKKFLKGRVFGPFLPTKEMEPWDGGYILIAGGTYGYKELLDVTSKTDLRDVVLQTGRVDPTEYQRKHPEWKVFSTTDHYKELIAGANTVVAPPGATPLEAVAYGKPLVIVRYPMWSKAGTIEDARLFANKLNAPFLSKITTKNLDLAIIKAKGRRRPELQNGAALLAEYLILNSS